METIVTDHPTEGRILITGIAGALGRLLARRLHRDHPVHGVDRTPFPTAPRDVVLHHLDYRKKKIEDLFRHGGIRAVYHLGLVQTVSTKEQTAHLAGTQQLLEFCDRWRVPKVVIVSSAMVYGALPTNSHFLPEEAPLLGGMRFPQIRGLVEIDMLAQSFFWRHSDLGTVILRPVHIVGRHVLNPVCRYLRRRTVYVPFGFDPMMQFIHEEDVVEALALCLKPEAKGIFNVVGPGEVPLSVALWELGRRSVPVPHPMLDFAARQFRRFGKGLPPEPDYARFVCLADGARAREVLGFAPRRTLRETIRALNEVD